MIKPKIGDAVILYVQWHTNYPTKFAEMHGTVIEAYQRKDCIMARIEAGPAIRIALPPVTGSAPPWKYTLVAGDKRDRL